MKVIGLTGNIGSGKSTVARILAELGAEVVDADALARQARQELAGEICRAFPAACRNGLPDDRKLAEIVFADPDSRRKLESILHPRVRELIVRKITEARSAGPGLLIVEAPLLYETGWNPGYDGVLVITAPDEARYRRVKRRSGLSKAEFYRRDAAQLPQYEKARQADWVINNGGTAAELRSRVRRWWREVSDASDA
ncbi:dephospho-CoA kinase [Oceanithermus sp.]